MASSTEFRKGDLVTRRKGRFAGTVGTVVAGGSACVGVVLVEFPLPGGATLERSLSIDEVELVGCS